MLNLIKILILFIFFINNVSAENFSLKKIASLSKPWGLSFINDNELIISEKTGKIKIVNITNGQIKEVKHNLNYKNVGQGGLLDIVYKDKYVWIAYTEEVKKREYTTSIAKGKFSSKKIKFKNILGLNQKK